MSREKQQEKYVLWLPSWYPDVIDVMNGDFIQRHAEAVSLHQRVIVLYVVRDPTGAVTKSVSKHSHTKGDLTETIIYYYVRPGRVLLFQKMSSFFRAFALYKHEIRALFKKQGLPSLVHVHIVYKAGLLALWIKSKWKIPYVITEHWTIYLRETTTSFDKLSLFVKWQFRRIFRNAIGVSVVSGYLGNRLLQLFNIREYKVIPNVVNTDLFYPPIFNVRDVVRFTHISVLNDQKDPGNMLKAFFIVKQNGYDFHLTVIGPGYERWKLLAASLGLSHQVNFTGELSYSAVSDKLRESDALILYSRYETFGCVLIEANACGVPVIVSDIPVFHENIKNGINGIFAKKEDPADLAHKISWFIDNQSVFNKAEIASHTKESYNYYSVGKNFVEWYKSCLTR